MKIFTSAQSTILGYSLDHFRPLTETVADAALIMDVLLNRSDRSAVGSEATLRGVRLGVPRDYFTIAADSVSATYDRVLRDAEAAGARLVPISLNRFETGPAVYLATSGAEAAAIHYRTLAHSSAHLGSDVRVRLTARYLSPPSPASEPSNCVGCSLTIWPRPSQRST